MIPARSAIGFLVIASFVLSIGTVEVFAQSDMISNLSGSPIAPLLPLESGQADIVGAPAESVFPQGFDPDKMVSPQGLTPTLKLMVMLTLISLAPSILIMTTCFIRIVIVLGILRQALGTQQLPPNQVLLSLGMFLTIMVMWPVWKQAYENGIQPYSESTYETTQDQEAGLQLAAERSLKPIRRFMSDQIFRTGNENAVWMFIDYQRPAPGTPEASNWKAPENFDEVHTTVLIPAFMLSELKTAFIIGFQIYLPFIIIDMVVASILISMGMMMLPPVLISLPFKLLLFVLVDGWYLTVEMLLHSVQPFTGTG
ncbi:MAG TPA: flagellar biosynthetic protein FliP [Planctomycetaceae bacterium]|nr:flagellar biosynthetic protein FliP [Planctomycetaceae bacterium]